MRKCFNAVLYFSFNSTCAGKPLHSSLVLLYILIFIFMLYHIHIYVIYYRKTDKIIILHLKTHTNKQNKPHINVYCINNVYKNTCAREP